MKNIEERVIDKIFEIINWTLAKIIKPDMTINTVTDLDEKTINYIKEKFKIEGIILDVDDTIRKNMKNIPPCTSKWLDQIKKQLKVIVVSNGIDKNIQRYLKEKNIDYIGFATKPLKINFKRACKKMNLSPEKVLVIGDSLFADIYGGKRNNMWSVLVKTVEGEER